MVYFLSSILAVAKEHPFYNDCIVYPPDVDAVSGIAAQSSPGKDHSALASWPLLHKNKLYSVIERLIIDSSCQNTYRRGVYASITGGGRGSRPLFFAADLLENRQQRTDWGRLISACGIVSHGDWVVTLHSAGNLYRALDLVLESIENAGATALSAGNHMSPAEVIEVLIDYHVNVLAGDSSQVVNLVNHITELPKEKRDKICLEKLIYTSEVLTAAQRAHIRRTLGDSAKICSLFACAETGPWAVSNPELTGERTTTASDFIYDKRSMHIEILPTSAVDDSAPQDAAAPLHQPLPEGETGAIVLTSLARLRHPLVRYVSGDIGSLQPLPKSAGALLPEADRAHLGVVRFDGRDRRFSFDWEGEYIEFGNLAAVVESEEYAILQWQAIIANRVDDREGLRPTLEVRMLPSAATRSNKELMADLVRRIKYLIEAVPSNEHRFIPRFLDSIDGFERSQTGGKVIKFVDRVH